MTELHVLKVFMGPDGRGGNPLGVFLDGPSIAPQARQAVAADLGFSETVWIDDHDDEAAIIRIFTPRIEMPFAGHPTIGTAWLLRETGRSSSVLRVPAGDVGTWRDGELTWIRARAAWAGTIVQPRQYATPAEVDALVPGQLGDPSLYAWAWQNASAGQVRVRFFPTEVGIVEDEATGLGGVVMGDLLGVPLTISQGVASELYVRPEPATGCVDVGGRVELVEVRDYVPRVGAP